MAKLIDNRNEEYLLKNDNSGLKYDGFYNHFQNKTNIQDPKDYTYAEYNIKEDIKSILEMLTNNKITNGIGYIFNSSYNLIMNSGSLIMFLHNNSIIIFFIVCIISMIIFLIFIKDTLMLYINIVKILIIILLFIILLYIIKELVYIIYNNINININTYLPEEKIEKLKNIRYLLFTYFLTTTTKIK